VIYAITKSNRQHAVPVLTAMHHDRGQMFAGRRNWDITDDKIRYVQDRFDTLDSTYLVARDASRRAYLASLRLLPSMGPHLLQSKFAFLCEAEVPVGVDIWELEQICTSPSLGIWDSAHTCLQLAAGLLEFALLNGIAQLSSIARASRLSQILSAGWKCAPPGPLRSVDGEAVGAISIRVCSEALQNFRYWLSLSSPTLHLEEMAQAA